MNLTQETLLWGFLTFPLLTVAQTTRVFYSLGSAKYVSHNLHQLVKDEYLHRKALALSGQRGSVPYCYALDKKGRKFLRDQGYDVSLLPTVQPIPDAAYLRHPLAVNDLLITATKVQGVKVKEMIHDIRLRKMLKNAPVFDAFIRFKIGKYEQCIALEYDSGSEDYKLAFQKKIERMVRFIQKNTADEPSGYEKIFGTSSLTIAFVTTKKNRIDTIRRWTEEKLASMDAKHEGETFVFAWEPDLENTGLYTDPVFTSAFGDRKVALLEM